ATGAGDDIDDREAINAAGRQDFEATGSVPDVSGNVGDAIVSAGLLAGGHDAGDAKIDQLIQRRERFRHDIKRAMKNRLPIATELFQLATAFEVDRAGDHQKSEGEASSALRQSVFRV